MVKFRVCKVNDIPPGTMQAFTLDGKQVLLSNVDGKFFCVQNMCSHREAPLDQGFLEGKSVICPHHAAQFDLETGNPTFPMPIPALQVFSVQVVGDDVLVEF